SRELGLMLGRTEHWFRVVREVAAAVNARFYTYDHGQKVGAAEAKRDTFVQLLRPRRYRNNLTRFMRVSLNIPYRFETMTRIDYIRELGRELLAIETAEDASVKLEAIGDDAVPKLLEGLQHSESAVQFYAAEALAYLGRGDGIKTLVAVAKNDSALRLRALTALGALEDMDAHESLTSLLESESAETRYGAFTVLQDLNPQDPTLGRNKNISGFNLFGLATTQAPMVHVSRKNRPEIVLFGQGQQFAATPFVLFAGKQFVVKCDVPGQIVVKRFRGDGGEEARNTGPILAEVIQAMAELGAEYPQVVQVLQESKRQGMLDSRLVFDALPRSGREYSPTELQLPSEVDAPEDP
ncbi:MAG: HEAT repeat domain-containing protein, partial [Planctomycetota bacterium]|nr:HEAT repeat domain-containing protein [Planctomycetota bacterium]